MKVILALILIIGVAYSVTIASDSSSNTWTLTSTANTANTSNVDLVLTLTHGSATLTSVKESIVACVDTGVSNYTLSADKASLGTFIAEVATASDDTLSGATPAIYGTTTAYVNSATSWTTVASTALTAPTHTDVSSTTTFAMTFSAVTPTELASMKLPNSTQKFYWKCFYAFKVAAVDVAASAVLNTALTSSTTVTFGNSGNGFIAIGAAVTSAIVASLI